MYTEMTYLLRELEKCPKSMVLTVANLIDIINDSYKTSERDCEEIENAITPDQMR